MGDMQDAKAARREAARALRAAGKSFAKIGQALGVSVERARRLVQEAADMGAALDKAQFEANGPIEGPVFHELIAWWQARGVPRRAAQALALAAITTPQAAVEWLRAWEPSDRTPQLGAKSITAAIDALTGAGDGSAERGELLLSVFGSPLPGVGQWVAVFADDAAKVEALKRLEAEGAVESKPAIMVRRRGKQDRLT